MRTSKTQSNNEKVRATRYVPKDTLTVSSKTIGTAITFNLTTHNISRSGMLLGWEQARPIPFIENTIIEMTIDPTAQFLKRPVQCLGKITRRLGNKPEQGAELMFGVAIIQIDNQDMDSWENCLSDLATSGATVMSDQRQEKTA